MDADNAKLNIYVPEGGSVDAKAGDQAAELENHGYLPIRNGDTCSFGGSQMWFQTRPGKAGSGRICAYGCGLIAFSDLLLYLAAQKKIRRPACMENLFAGGDRIEKASYMEYIRFMDRKFMPVIPFSGINGISLEIGLNHFFLREKLPFRASWKWMLTSQKMLVLMKEMLSDDIPVIFSIGPNTPFVWGKKGVAFCRKDPSGALAVQETVCRHYVMLTGISTDPLSGRTLLRISSWGREFYIDYGEYRSYVRRTGGKITSSIVYIRRKGASK